MPRNVLDPPAAGSADRSFAVTSLATPAPGGQVSEAFEALRAGDHVYNGRDIPISEADLDTAVANFNRYWKPAGGVPVDYDHSFVETGDSTAAGWVVAMERRGGSLYEQVRWTPKAAQQIADGEFRFYSAEFTTDWTNEAGEAEGFTVLGGALTNRPFLRGMTPVALSQAVETAAYGWAIEAYQQLERKVGEGESAGRDETQPEVADTLTVKIDGKAEEFTAERITELVEQTNADTFTVEIDGKAETFTAESITELRAQAAKAEGAGDKVETLSKRLEQVEGDLTAERFNSAFTRRQRQGALDAKPETREKWEDRLEKFGLEATLELLEDLPADVIPMGRRGRGGSEAPEVGEDQAPDGVEPFAFKVDQRAKALMADDKDLDYAAAARKAHTELSGAEA